MQSYPQTHLKAAIVLAAILTVVITTLPAQQRAKAPDQPISLEVEIAAAPESVTAALPVVSIPPVSRTDNIVAETGKWITHKIKSGDNLARIFQSQKIPAADLHNIIALGAPVSSLRTILPGQQISFKLNAGGELLAIRYEKNVFDTLLIRRSTQGFIAEWQAATPETIVAYESANITKERPSLYHAGKAAGLSDNVIMKLSHIFQWDISFALDLRAGDSFSVMYEKIYVDGEPVKEGNIIAASFSNMGKTYEAVRYTDIAGNSDYYTPDGLSMRKAFLRDPVHFSHVSSSFNLRRLHPIHKRVMPHRGIDYAARQGTPVLASGDGKVTIRRQNDASGKYIVIQHGEQYTTKYLHLSAFANGIAPGKTVRQGQTIGYVGSTGWATAPHLHYEFLVAGVHRNPRTVALPKAMPVARDELDRFRSTIAPVLAQLESVAGKSYANLSSGDRTTGG